MGAIAWSRPKVFLVVGATGFLGAVVGFTTWVMSLRMIAQIEAEEYAKRDPWGRP